MNLRLRVVVTEMIGQDHIPPLALIASEQSPRPAPLREARRQLK
jgi:hypothetical protein